MAELTVAQTFQTAFQHHQAGRLPQAEQLYRQILARQPNHAEALHMLGLIAAKFARRDAAVELIRRAIAIRPDFPEAHSNLANLLVEKGQFEEAMTACRAAIALRPNFPEAYYNLGNALRQTARLDEAIAAYRQAIAFKPGYAEALGNLGDVLQARGQFDEAIAAYHAAIALKRDLFAAHNNLGNSLQARGQLDDAIAAYRQAIAVNPNYAKAHSNLGCVLQVKGQFDEAIAACRAAVALNPAMPEFHSNLGEALQAGGRLDEAIAACRAAIALKPNFPEAYTNLGSALQKKRELDEATAAYRQAIALNPGHCEAHYNLGLVLLTRGNLSQGWDEYEWRWKAKGFTTPLRHFAQPLWDGRRLDGATLLLHAEQGFGDALQFIRYLPLAGERVAGIVIECQASLQRLFQTNAGGCSVVVRGESLPAFDAHCPLLSLPRAFRTTLDNIPGHVPYIYADVALAGQWRERLGADLTSLKVGLVWSGSKSNKKGRNRSLSLSALAPLGRIRQVGLYSLQKGERPDQAVNTPTELKLIDWTNDLGDFADTAALIANLDLVISVDTAVAHLAGAMGKPVWVMLPYASDWRWLLDHDDSPWYPTMRLFRQPSIGDWDSVVRRVADALAAMAHPADDPR